MSLCTNALLKEIPADEWHQLLIEERSICGIQVNTNPLVFDEDRLTQLVREKLTWDDTKIALVMAEYKKYLQMCKAFSNKRLSPDPLVDEVWHLHILDTMHYADFCEDYFGYFLHHTPRLAVEEVESARVPDTWNAYQQLFGDPPAQMWEIFAKCGGTGGCWSPGDERPSKPGPWC